MRVGFLTSSVSRIAGGPFEAMRALAKALHRPPELEVAVFGLSDGHALTDLPAWGPVPVSISAVQGPATFGFAKGLGLALRKSRLDLLHVHGIWMYPSIAGRWWSARTGGPYLISTHGMLDPWAVKHARWKKRIAGILYESAHLRSAACLHALCEPELEAIRAFGLDNPVCVVANGVESTMKLATTAPPWLTSLPNTAKVLLYLGRLHPKKGLLNLLRAWNELSGSPAARDWHLIVAGWDQDGHRADLEALAAASRIRNVRFIGPQFDSDKQATLGAANAFILPSYSEGLPMAVLEAWALELPVVMTPQCNLPEGFAAGAAIRIECDRESIASGLQTLFSMSENGLRAMGKAGSDLAATRFSWIGIATCMKAVYQWLLGIGPRPDCVILN